MITQCDKCARSSPHSWNKVCGERTQGVDSAGPHNSRHSTHHQLGTERHLRNTYTGN